MVNKERIVERREFFRLNFDAPLKFKSYIPEKPQAEATSRNISQSGVLFQMETNPPAISSILWMDVDLRTIKICQEIENRVLVCNQGLLGKVVRVEENPQDGNAYDVGVCFLTRDQQNTREVQEIISKIKQ